MPQLPRNILLAFVVSFAGFSFYLYETPINFFADINLQLAQYGIPVVLPTALESPWAFAYAAVPALFSLVVTVLYARGVFSREVPD